MPSLSKLYIAGICLHCGVFFWSTRSSPLRLLAPRMGVSSPCGSRAARAWLSTDARWNSGPQNFMCHYCTWLMKIASHWVVLFLWNSHCGLSTPLSEKPINGSPFLPKIAAGIAMAGVKQSNEDGDHIPDIDPVISWGLEELSFEPYAEGWGLNLAELKMRTSRKLLGRLNWLFFVIWQEHMPRLN